MCLLCHWSRVGDTGDSISKQDIHKPRYTWSWNGKLKPGAKSPFPQQPAACWDPADGKQTQALSGAPHLPQQLLITLKAERPFRHLRRRVSAPSRAIHPTEGITCAMNVKLGFNSTVLMQTPLAWRHREEPCPPPPHIRAQQCVRILF